MAGGSASSRAQGAGAVDTDAWSWSVQTNRFPGLALLGEGGCVSDCTAFTGGYGYDVASNTRLWPTTKGGVPEADSPAARHGRQQNHTCAPSTGHIRCRANHNHELGFWH